MGLLPPILTIDREAFQLTLWKPRLLAASRGYVPKRRYQIAVGMLGHETPAGMYFVEGKTRTPDWRAPDSDWVPLKDRGKVFYFDDPRNPFAGGFISISSEQGIGIHGTKFDPQLGHNASHGCIRMAVPDFLDLYGRVVVLETPVFVY